MDVVVSHDDGRNGTARNDTGTTAPNTEASGLKESTSSDDRDVRTNDENDIDIGSDNRIVIHICDICRHYLHCSSGGNDNNINHMTSKNCDTTIILDINGASVVLKSLPRQQQQQQQQLNRDVPCRECCFVCLGLFQQNDTDNSGTGGTDITGSSKDDANAMFTQRLVNSVLEASKPYNIHDNGQDYKNRYSRHKSIPTIVLPGDMIYRFVLVFELLQQRPLLPGMTSNTSSSTRPLLLPPSHSDLTRIIHEYITEMKQHMKRMIHDCCNIIESFGTNQENYYNTEYPTCILEEELGYLTFHTIVIPTVSIVHRPMDFLQQQQQRNNQKCHHRNKRTRKERMMKQNQQYTIHESKDTTPNDGPNDNTRTTVETPYMEQSQGGDPRVNFERRFQWQQQQHHQADGSCNTDIQNDTVLWTIHQAMDHLDDLHKYIFTLIQRESNHLYEHLQFMALSQPANIARNEPLSCHTTVWRRPFYIRGIYTKILRTISQTPFFVIDDVVTVQNGTTNVKGEVVQKCRRRLGTTSVEEVITPLILQATNGVATHNNSYMNHNTLDPSVVTGSRTATSGVVYGMAKFHASGREDMNVRMLLPLSYNYNVDDIHIHNISSGAESDHVGISVEPPKITGRPFVYEIYDAIRLPRIHDLVDIVSSINHVPLSSSPATSTAATVMNDIRRKRRSYGCNPLGVDISNEISFVPSSSYKRLQEETENKIKYYECYCWCEQSIDQIIQSLLRKQQRQEQYPNDPIAIDKEELLNELLFGHMTFPIEIQQRTPLRVLHRRTNMIRQRYIYSCRIQLLVSSDEGNNRNSTSTDVKDHTNDTNSMSCTSNQMNVVPKQYQVHHFIVHLSTSAGTYVKEFIHGDMGRTVPNLSTLLLGTKNICDRSAGCRTDILELDCTGIQS